MRDKIAEDLKVMSVEYWMKLAKDRNKWRQVGQNPHRVVASGRIISLMKIKNAAVVTPVNN